MPSVSNLVRYVAGCSVNVVASEANLEAAAVYPKDLGIAFANLAKEIVSAPLARTNRLCTCGQQVPLKLHSLFHTTCYQLHEREVLLKPHVAKTSIFCVVTDL